MSQQQQGAPPPGGGSSAQQTVILGNLKSDIDQEALEGLCHKLGRVVSFRLHTSGPAADSPATAVVEYASPQEAARVVASVKGRLVSGQPVTACVTSAGANHRQLTKTIPVPGATTAGPPLQPSAIPLTADEDGHSRGPYPIGGLGRRNTNHGAAPENGGSLAFRGYQHTQQQPPPIDGEVSRKALAGTAGSSSSDWEGGGREGIPSSRRGVEHPPSTARYGEAYPHSDQQHSSWTASGGTAVAARRNYHGDTIGEPSRYIESGDAVPFPAPTANARQRQQWHGDTISRGDSWEKEDSQEWPHNPDDASHYTRGARAGGSANVRSTYPSPPGPSPSAWTDEIPSQVSRAYGSDGHLPPVHRMITSGSRGPGDPPRPHDIHLHERGRYGNDANGGPVQGNRHRHSSASAQGGLAVPASNRPSAWNEQAGYATPSLAVPNNDEFEKEVMRQAAKLVAERELAARDEARKKQEQARQQLQRQQNHQQQSKQNERDDWKNGGSLATAGHRRRRAQDGDRHTGRETRSTERLPSTTAPGITTQDCHDRPKPSRSTEERDRAKSKSKQDRNDNSRERDRRNQQQPHQDQQHSKQRVPRVGSRDRGEEGSAKRAKRAAVEEGSDRDGRRDGNKRARRDVTPASKRHKGNSVAGKVTDDKKNSSSTSAKSKRELKSRPLPMQQPDRAKPPREDTRARPREDDRAARLAPRPHDDQRERERQHNEAKTTARLAKRTPVDERGGGGIDVSKREDHRVAKARPAPAATQLDNVNNRDRERKREDLRAGTRPVPMEDDRLRGRARGSRDNIRTTGIANAKIDNTTREWDGAAKIKTRPFKVAPRVASGDLISGHPQDAGRHPLDPGRFTQDLGRHPQGVGRHPQDVGRHPQDGGRHPQGVGRHPQEVGRHPQDVGRHPQDAGRHPQGVGRHPQDVGKHLKGVGRHPQDAGKHPEDIGRHPHDFGRHPQGRHPQDVGRHPQDVGRRPQDVGRPSQDIGVDWRLKKRPAEDRTPVERTPAERVAAERNSNRVSDRVADRLRGAAISNNVGYQHEGSTADTGWYVHVGGLSFSTTFTDLAKRFAAFGNVTGFKIIFNHITCKTERASDGNVLAEAPAVVVASTGFAFVSFEDEEGMLKAIEGMNDQVLDGHVLKVTRGRGQGKTAQVRHQKEIQPSDQLHRALKAPRRNPTGQQSNDKQEPHPQAYPALSSAGKKMATERTPSKANRSTGTSSMTAKSKVNPTTPKAKPAVMVERSAAAASSDKATATRTLKQEEIPAAGFDAGEKSAAETVTKLVTPKQESPASGVGAVETGTMPRATFNREDFGVMRTGSGTSQRNNGTVTGVVDGGVEKCGDRPDPATGATDARPQNVEPSAIASSGDTGPGAGNGDGPRDGKGEGSRDGNKQRSADEDDKGAGDKNRPGDKNGPGDSHEVRSEGDNARLADGDKNDPEGDDAKGPGGGECQGPGRGDGDVKGTGDGGHKRTKGNDTNGTDALEETESSVNTAASTAGTN